MMQQADEATMACVVWESVTITNIKQGAIK